MIRFAVQTLPVIKLAAIRKVYHTGEVDVHAVRGISLDIFPGEFVAIMGSSGSGKSTLMNMIGALDRPSGGSYLLDGIDVSTLDRDALADVRNEKIGFVFQGFNLLSRTSALENVETADALQPPPHPIARAAGTRHKRARSGGPRPARQPSSQPAFRRPASSAWPSPARWSTSRRSCSQRTDGKFGQPQTSIEIMGVFQKLNDQGITIIMVTHELDIARYTRRNVILRDGNIISDTVVASRLNAEKELQQLRTRRNKQSNWAEGKRKNEE